MKRIACLFALGILLSAVTAPLPPASVRAQDEEPVMQGCGDFLAQMRRKPAHVTYAGCDYAPDRQGKPLQARYHVPGRFAAAAEAYFARTVGLVPLKRSCCQWDAPAAQFRDSTGRDVSISMVSEETAVARRSEWPEIAVFAIIVEILTEEI